MGFNSGFKGLIRNTHMPILSQTV